MIYIVVFYQIVYKGDIKSILIVDDSACSTLSSHQSTDSHCHLPPADNIEIREKDVYILIG